MHEKFRVSKLEVRNCKKNDEGCSIFIERGSSFFSINFFESLAYPKFVINFNNIFNLTFYSFIESPTFLRSWSILITLTFTISPTETKSEGFLI